MIKEWNLLRTISCLSIVLLHATTNTGRAIGYPDINNYHIYRIILCFATPTFIFLSEMIIANRYQNSIPDNFFSKRIKLIFGPFITFALVDSIISSYINSNGVNTIAKFISNLQGDFEGYFILIIFQFYILHFLIIKFQISVKKILPISIIIMIFHLYVLNYSDIPFIVENNDTLRLPFTAWFGYFTIAYLVGSNYKKVITFLYEYRWLTIIALVFSIYLIFTTYQAGHTEVHSRRMDIFPLSITMTLFILAWGKILPNFKVINIISNYSLGIYLLHWQIQRLIAPYTANLFESTKYQILFLFLISLILSMAIIKLVSLFSFGKYLVGNVKRNYAKTKVNHTDIPSYKRVSRDRMRLQE